MYPDIKSARIEVPHDPDMLTFPRTELLAILADDAQNKIRLAILASEKAELQTVHGKELDAAKELAANLGTQVAEANEALASTLSRVARRNDELRRLQYENDSLNRHNEDMHKQAESLRAEIRSLKRKRRA
jgi:predicted RNase H-like nuclease (RuvC/YqgF family)